MKLIIHDLEPEQALGLIPTDGHLSAIAAKNTGKACIGCFGCWVKTPGRCVIADELQDMGKTLSRCSDLVLISRCCYGGFSPSVKRVMDRSIPYLHPCFTMKNDEMHHRRRYENHIKISVYFYGPDITDKEKETAEHLVRANCVNLDGEAGRIAFFHTAEELRGEAL